MSPIRASERCRYPKNWPAISLRIREREGQRCKWCGAPNGRNIVRYRDTHAWMVVEPGVSSGFNKWFSEDGPVLLQATSRDCTPVVKVVLTVAHLDHTPENCDESNLAALCQRCHNRYDAPTRRAGIRERAGVLSLELEC